MERVLCIVGGMNAGGAETFLMKIYRALDKSKYQMDFAVGIKEEAVYDSEIIKMGGIIHRVTPKSEGFFKNFNSIKKIVKENGYKSVLRISQHSLSALELLAAKMGGAKTLAFRSSSSNTLGATKKSRLLHKLFMFLPKFIANVKIAPSTEAGVFMFGKRALKKGKVIILNNGLDLDTIKYDAVSRGEVRKEFNISDDTVLVGHVGRFAYEKNHNHLINVFSEIKKITPNSKLALVGCGEKESEIKSQISKLELDDSVVLTGVRRDVARLFSAMDVFVFPSFYEGMPNTVIEAQATGLPCLVSDSVTKECKITDIVEFISLNCSAKEWAEKSLSLLSNERRDTRVDFINNHYDIESVANKFVEIIFSA